MKNDEIHDEAKPTWDRVFGIRHLQIFLLSTCLAVALTMRVNMSVAIVPMTNSSRGNPDFPDYGWSSSTQSIILSSFSWGYVVTQIPAGQLGQMYGPKMFLLGAIAINSVFCLLTPLAAQIGDWQLVCLCRLLQGLCQGFCFPSCHILLSKWSTSTERGSFTSYVYSATQAGIFIGHLVCGALIKSSAGWPTVFYLFGSLGILWSIVWFFLGANGPEFHKYISKEEKMYLQSYQSEEVKEGKQRRSTPWFEIFTSGPVWAIIISQCGANWGFWTLLTEIPSYLSYIYNVDIAENGLLSALPYFTHWIASFVFSAISKFIISRKIISLEMSRKIFNTIALGVAAVPLAVLTIVPPGNTVLAIALLTICVGTTSAYYVGHHVNHIDLAPNYAGTMMGIGNCAANILAIVAPLLVGVTVKDQNDSSQWNYVFYIAASFYIFSTITYIFMGKATIQPWNNPEFKSNRRRCF